MKWTDGSVACFLDDETGTTVAIVVRGNDSWEVFNPRKMNATETGPLMVKDGFATADAAKQFADSAVSGW